jgi:type II secretory pathway component PulF
MLAVGTRPRSMLRYCGAVVVRYCILALEKYNIAERATRSGFILKLPLLGDIWLKYQVANFSRMLSTLLAGGLPLVPSLETAGASMSSRNILNGIAEAALRVREGQTLAPAAWKSRRCFPIFRWR